MSIEKIVNSQRAINSASTGGAGHAFEESVQAYFLFLMMTGGLVPKMPSCKIEKLVFQSRDFETDDCVAFIKDVSNHPRQVLMQIKRGDSAKINSQEFRAAIKDAWQDFQNDKFNKTTDRIFFITGHLNGCDNKILSILDDHIHHGNSSESFWKNYEANCFSQEARKKFEKIIEYITDVNNDTGPSKEELFSFFKVFYIIKSDLHDNTINEGGINLSLIQSILSSDLNGKRFINSPQSIWDSLFRFAADHNNGEDIPSDHKELIKLFDQQPVISQSSRALEGANIYPELNLKDTTSTTTIYPEELALLSLIGSFNEKNAADIKIIEKLFNDSFDNIKLKLRKMLLDEKNLDFFENGVWRISNSQRDTIHRLANQIFDDHIDLLKDIYIEVIGEIDPALDLPVEKRYMANIFKKQRSFSKALCSGLVDGVAIIANNEGWFVNCTTNKIDYTAREVTQKLCKNNMNPKLWASLNDYLTPLAETCPSIFLECLEKILKQKDNPFIELSKESNQTALSTTDYLSGLRWALADLAWDKNLCARACGLLMKLADIEQTASNGQNYCIEAVVDTVLPWRPQTMASVEVRYAIVKNALKDNFEIGWSALEQLLPNKTTSQAERHLPVWRNNIVQANWEKNITNTEVQKQYDEYSRLYVENANEFKQIINVIDNIHHLSQPGLDILIEKIPKISNEKLSETEQTIIWDRLINIIDQNKQHRKLPDGTITRLQEISEQFAPKDMYKKCARLFDHYDHELINCSDYKSGESKLREERKKSINTLLNRKGLDEVIKLVDHVRFPYQVGLTLALSDERGLDKKVLPKYLNDGDEKHNEFARNFVSGKFYRLTESDRWDWAHSIDKEAWSDNEIVEFAKSLPFAERTWEFINHRSIEAQNAYWKTVQDVRPYKNQAFSAKIVDKLLTACRPSVAVEYIYYTLYSQNMNQADRTDTVDIEQCKKSLLALMRSKEPLGATKNNYQTTTYEITHVIEFIQNNVSYPDNDLLSIEWYYFSILCSCFDIKPRALIYTISNSPEDFYYLLNLMFKTRNSSTEQETNLSEEMCDCLYDLLVANKFNILPGNDENEDFNSSKFISWIKQTKILGEKDGLWSRAQNVIGGYLTHAPADPNGLFIHRTIAEELDKENNDEMRVGYELGIINQYGFRAVDPTGKDRIELAKRWDSYANEIDSAGYARFATSLRKISESFKADAKRDKVEDQLFRAGVKE